MKKPRFSIAGLMAIVVLIAVDCLAWRGGLGGRELSELVLCLGALPMANILAIGLLARLEVKKRGERPPRFLNGFLVLGGIFLSFYVMLSIADARSGFASTIWLRVIPRTNRLALQAASVIGLDLIDSNYLRVGFAAAFLSSVPFVPAVIGGLAYRRFGVELVEEGVTTPRKIPNSPEN